MFEGDPTATTPMSPIAPPPAPVRRGSGIPAGRLVALGLLAFALAAFSGRVDLGALVTSARSYVNQTAPSAQTNTNSTDAAAVAAVKDVVARANQAQVQAYARNDPTLMRATATDSYYQELLQTNQGIQSSGARSIELVSLDWVDVTISGSTASRAATGFRREPRRWSTPVGSRTPRGSKCCRNPRATYPSPSAPATRSPSGSRSRAETIGSSR